MVGAPHILDRCKTHGRTRGMQLFTRIKIREKLGPWYTRSSRGVPPAEQQSGARFRNVHLCAQVPVTTESELEWSVGGRGDQTPTQSLIHGDGLIGVVYRRPLCCSLFGPCWHYLLFSFLSWPYDCAHDVVCCARSHSFVASLFITA